MYAIGCRYTYECVYIYIYIYIVMNVCVFYFVYCIYIILQIWNSSLNIIKDLRSDITCE